MQQKIEQRLQAALSPTYLEVTNDSHKHIGHAGARPDGNTHFKVTVESAAFVGLSRVKRHQLVYKTLDGMMDGEQGIHALQLFTHTAEERAA